MAKASDMTGNRWRDPMPQCWPVYAERWPVITWCECGMPIDMPKQVAGGQPTRCDDCKAAGRRANGRAQDAKRRARAAGL